MRNSRVLNLRIDGIQSRLDRVLLKQLRESEGLSTLSRATLKQWFKKGLVLAKGRPLSAHFSFPAALPETPIEITILDWQALANACEPAARPSLKGAFLPIVYEDESLLVLNKESGVPSVPHQSDETETAVGAALAHWPGLSSVAGGTSLEPGILHRLDTGTSGLLAFAKTTEEYDRLRAAWKSGEVRKSYRAITPGATAPLQLPLLLEPRLAHDAGSAKRMLVVQDGIWREGMRQEIRGKVLPTRTRLVSARSLGDRLDLEIQIETGVMHQIRCTLASIGLPILGDRIYRGKESSRLWLHAWRLGIPLRSGGRLELEAALPSGWPGSRAEK